MTERSERLRVKLRANWARLDRERWLAELGRRLGETIGSERLASIERTEELLDRLARHNPLAQDANPWQIQNTWCRVTGDRTVAVGALTDARRVLERHDDLWLFTDEASDNGLVAVSADVLRSELIDLAASEELDFTVFEEAARSAVELSCDTLSGHAAPTWRIVCWEVEASNEFPSR